MKVTCRNITNLPYGNQLRLLSGREGLDNQIQWVHYLEEPRYTEWLKGGELIIISGLVTTDKEGELTKLITNLWEKDVAGIIINISFFIEKIPESVKRLGDKLGIPIFEMPANVRIEDISKSICFAIFNQTKEVNDIQKTLLDVLYGSRLSEKRIHKLFMLGIRDDIIYRAVAIQGIEPAEQIDVPKDYFYDEDEKSSMTQLEDFFQLNYIGKFTLYVVYRDYFIFFLTEEQKSLVGDLMEELKKNYPGIRWRSAIGSRFSGARSLKESADNAILTLEVNTDLKGKTILNYDDMIDLRLFGSIEDIEILKSIMSDILDGLLLEENQELLRTLKIYIMNDCNNKKTAEELFIHTNTIYYRLNKIEELTHRSLSSSGQLFQIILGLKIYEYLSNHENDYVFSQK